MSGFVAAVNRDDQFVAFDCWEIGETAPEAMRVRRETIVNELLQVEDDVKYRIQLCDWSSGMQQNRVEGWRDWFLGAGPPNKGVNPTTLARVVAAAKRALELAF